MITEFKLNDCEAKAAREWVSEHVCRARWWRFTYSFTPTEIGDAVTISCHCGAKKNITDYNFW